MPLRIRITIELELQLASGQLLNILDKAMIAGKETTQAYVVYRSAGKYQSSTVG